MAKRIKAAVGREIELTDGDWQEILEIVPTLTQGQLTVRTARGTYAVWELDHQIR